MEGSLTVNKSCMISPQQSSRRSEHCTVSSSTSVNNNQLLQTKQPFDVLQFSDPTCFSELINQMRICQSYTEEKGIIYCEVCKKHFENISDLVRHIKIFHLNTFPFHCLFCPEMFSKVDFLNKHTKKMHTKELKTYVKNFELK